MVGLVLSVCLPKAMPIKGPPREGLVCFPKAMPNVCLPKAMQNTCHPLSKGIANRVPSQDRPSAERVSTQSNAAHVPS